MSARTWPHLLTTVLSGQDLAAEDTAWAMRQVMADQVEPAALAGFLVALRAKGESVSELAELLTRLEQRVGIEREDAPQAECLPDALGYLLVNADGR